MNETRSDYDEIWREAYGDLQAVGPAHRHLRRRLARRLEEIEFDSALEVGCGAGDNLPLLFARCDPASVAGADISTEALERTATIWPEVDLHELDIEQKALAGTWDLVFSCLVLEHLERDAEALANMRRMTGRSLLVVTMAGNYERYLPWETQVGHVRNYRRGELEQRVEEAGFRVKWSEYWGFPFYNPVARTLQNRVTATPEFDRRQRFIAEVMYRVYFLNLPVRGDIVTLLAEPV